MSKTVQVDIKTISAEIHEQVVNCGVDIEKPLHLCRCVTVNSTTYHKNTFVVVSCKNEEIVSGRLQKLFVHNLKVNFCVQLHNSIYAHHFSAFSIHQMSRRVVKSYTDFLDHYPMSAYEVKGQKYLVLKNFVFDKK